MEVAAQLGIFRDKLAFYCAAELSPPKREKEHPQAWKQMILVGLYLMLSLHLKTAAKHFLNLPMAS
ncbi:unnamed protein product [Blumeria hordei]|uniref:Uncharacterized protein n=1 Tax=Blumeria hordei TaxID=2867405 RepID=A0A383UZS2_BLUHO|nr:unnamed protein product [Blumeria hordei]